VSRARFRIGCRTTVEDVLNDTQREANGEPTLLIPATKVTMHALSVLRIETIDLGKELEEEIFIRAPQSFQLLETWVGEMLEIQREQVGLGANLYPIQHSLTQEGMVRAAERFNTALILGVGPAAMLVHGQLSSEGAHNAIILENHTLCNSSSVRRASYAVTIVSVLQQACAVRLAA
jgi:hypothetical protein